MNTNHDITCAVAICVTNTTTTTTAVISTNVTTVSTVPSVFSAISSSSVSSASVNVASNGESMIVPSEPDIEGMDDVSFLFEIDSAMEMSDAAIAKEKTSTKHQRKRWNKKQRLEARMNSGVSDDAGSTSAGPVIPNTSLPLPEDVAGKRPRTIGDTPPDVQHGQKRVKSFASVVRNMDCFRIGVADKATPTGFTEEKRGLLLSLIHNAVVCEVESGAFIPILRGHYMQANMMIFNCVNQESRAWLTERINQLNADWEGSQLYVVDDPTFLKIKCWFPGPIEEYKRVCTLLEKFNAGLITSGWRMAGQIKYENKGQLLFVFIDPFSLKYLEKVEFKLQFVLNTVSIKLAGDKPASLE